MISNQRELVRFLETQDKPWQLVKHWEDVPEKKRGNGPWYVEKKYDGVFCAVVMGGDMPICISRTGKQFWHEVNAKVLALCPPDSMTERVLICELINSTVSLEELSGLVNPNRVNEWTPKQERLMCGVDLVIHDVLTFHEVQAGFSTKPQKERRRLVHTLHLRCHVAAGLTAYSWLEVEQFALMNIEHGNEGIVIKQESEGYVAGHKGYRVMKWVRDLHVDLKCLAVETGKGKRTGQIARLQFKYKGKLFWADLGAGWTDGKRIALTLEWENATGCNCEGGPLGKIFHLSALQESSKGVLRLPKVNELRIDKFEEDIT
jgi:ATP-dependent DNA ligase